MIFVCEAKYGIINQDKPHDSLSDSLGRVVLNISAKSLNEAKLTFESSLYSMFEKNTQCRFYKVIKVALDEQ